MEKYRFLAHTADMKFRAFGKTLEEAYANAALALADTFVNVKKVKGTTKKTIKIESEDKQALLYDFLEQFLYFLDTKHFVIGKVNSLKIKEGKKFKLTAVVSGGTDIKKYGFKRHVKAVTYNDMIVDEKKGKVMLQVVLDL